MVISIFTPTYNRAVLLKRVYESLLLQTEKDFEWIVVDDGSTDDTEAVVAEFIKESKIKITYQKQVNKGKHFAINKGVSLAIAELFFIVDSDDFLPKDAVEKVLSYYERIKSDSKIAGVAGRRMYKSNEIVGNSNFDELVTNSIDIRYKYNVSGDLVEVFKTEVLRKFPFPEIIDEKFCPEALIWNRIAQDYNLLFFNEGIYITEYIAGGLTANIIKIRMNSPEASMLCYSELAAYPIPFFEKLKATINFWRFSFNSSRSFNDRTKKVSPQLSVIALPLAFAMHLNDKKNML